MSAMGEALIRAGIFAENDDLLKAAEAALTENPRNWDDAKRALWKTIHADAKLLRAIFEPYRQVALQRCLTNATTLMREAEKPLIKDRLVRRPSEGGGHAADDVHKGNAPAHTETEPLPVQIDVETAIDGGHSVADDQAASAPVDDTVQAPPELADDDTMPPGRPADVVLRSRATFYLRSFLINGQPIGLVTPREAIAWSKSRRRDLIFVSRLTENIPLDSPIGQFRTEDEAAAIYAQAQELVDA